MTVDNLDEDDENVEVKVNRRFFCRAHSQRRIKWDLFIMLLATINCFQVPYNVAFTDVEDSNIFLDIFNGFIDFFFMIDVVINFRTSYINDATGVEELNLKTISVKYLKSRFTVDLLASIPIDFLSYAFAGGAGSNTFLLQMFGLLKLVRVLRLSRLITYLNLKNNVKMSLKLIKLIFFLVMYLHCLGCLWYFIVKQEKAWIPPLDYVFITTDIYNESSFYKYVSSLYHAVLMLGGNDVGPRDAFQTTFVTFMLIMAAIINANIFGNMAVLIQSLNRKATTFQEKMEYASETMKNLRIPELIQDDVKTYLTYTQTTSDHQKDLDMFLNMLSPSLRQQVSVHIFLASMKRNTVFKGKTLF